MGLIKPNNYDQDEVRFSKIANALSHPARTRILEIVKVERLVKNNDLSDILNLNKSSVTRHLNCLKRADLISGVYHTHFEEISLNQKTLEYFNNRLEKFSET